MTPSGVDPAALPPAPAALTAPCEAAEFLDGALTASDVVRLWALDRGRLLDCGARLAAVVAFYYDRDALLIGSRPE